MYGLKRTIERLQAMPGGKKLLALLAALSIILAGATGGTLAWYAFQTPAAVNTFTAGNIAITLTETDTETDNDQNPDTNAYPMDLGSAIAKDPRVTVLAGSENCWLYVQLDESENFAQFMEYDLADGWQALPGVPGVVYRPVDRADEAQVFPVLQDDLVYGKPTVTLEAMAALTEGSYPTLTITAFAMQRSSASPAIGTPEGAWQQLLGEISVP